MCILFISQMLLGWCLSGHQDPQLLPSVLDGVKNVTARFDTLFEAVKTIGFNTQYC